MMENPSEDEVFFSRLRQIREKRGMTLQQLGDLIGTSPQDIYHLEKGQMPRKRKRFVAIADALGVSLDWLFGRPGATVAFPASTTQALPPESTPLPKPEQSLQLEPDDKCPVDKAGKPHAKKRGSAKS